MCKARALCDQLVGFDFLNGFDIALLECVATYCHHDRVPKEQAAEFRRPTALPSDLVPFAPSASRFPMEITDEKRGVRVELIERPGWRTIGGGDGETVDMEWHGKYTSGQSWCRGTGVALSPEHGGGVFVTLNTAPADGKLEFEPPGREHMHGSSVRDVIDSLSLSPEKNHSHQRTVWNIGSLSLSGESNDFVRTVRTVEELDAYLQRVATEERSYFFWNARDYLPLIRAEVKDAPDLLLRVIPDGAHAEPVVMLIRDCRAVVEELEFIESVVKEYHVTQHWIRHSPGRVFFPECLL